MSRRFHAPPPRRRQTCWQFLAVGGAGAALALALVVLLLGRW